MYRRTAYWIATCLLAATMLAAGGAEVALRSHTADGMRQLGYPLYFVQFIGTWKVLGALTLLAPGFARLKEWAYAGIFFNMIGAAVSHAATGSAGWHLAVTLSFVGLTLASWYLRPSERMLGQFHAGLFVRRGMAVGCHARGEGVARGLAINVNLKEDRRNPCSV
ncbi:MAG: DoxX family protein [Bryobacterales bacterium]|nr:DoxX family protein [Bryobacterales bacterium]